MFEEGRLEHERALGRERIGHVGRAGVGGRCGVFATSNSEEHDRNGQGKK